MSTKENKKLAPFPNDIFNQPGVLLYVANVVGKNGMKKLQEFCKYKIVNNIAYDDTKQNIPFNFVEGPKRYGWFCEIDGIPTVSIQRSFYRDFLGCACVSHRLLAFKPISLNKMGVALVRHNKFSRYALSHDVKTFLKEFSEFSDVTIEYYNGNIHISIPKAPNPVTVHDVILTKDGNMIECDKKLETEKKKHNDDEIDSDMERLFRELDNVTFKRMVSVDENEDINDFMERIIEESEKDNDFYNHIDELYKNYPNICMMCGSRHHDCCGYDNQYGESFEEGLYHVFRCSTIVNTRCDKCNYVFSANFNKQTNIWDKKCKCK